MGPRKPRRLNINDVWNDYKEDPPERHEPQQNFCLETCFTTFPEPQTVVITPAAPPHKIESKKLPFFHKSEERKPTAPLAQPEYFSDTSSLASTTSNWDNVQEATVVDVVTDSAKLTQVMKRTPKMIGSLSTCMDDIRNVKTFEKLVKNSNNTTTSNSSSNLSSASGLSSKTNCSNDHEHFVGMSQCSWQRGVSHWDDPIERPKTSSLAEDLLEEILEYAECAEFFKSDSLLSDYGEELLDNDDKREKAPSFLKLPETTASSPLILSPSSLDIDPDVISNYAIDLNLDQEHRSLLSYQNLQTSILKVSQAGTCNGSHSPLCSKTVTFNPDVQSIDDKIFMGSSDYSDKKKDRFSLFWRYFKKFKRTNSESDVGTYVSTISSENNCVESKFERRNEDLPLLDLVKTDTGNT